MTYSQEFIDEHRYFNVGHDWWDSVYSDFEQICEILGIDLDKNEPSFSGFWSQGDGASWTGAYRAQRVLLGYETYGQVSPTYDLAPQKIREHAPKDEELHRIADELCLLARIYGSTYAMVRRYNSHYVHSSTMCVSEWEYWDEDIGFEGVDEAIAYLIEETLLTQFRALADWLYSTLEKEHEYLTSDEAVIESLKANEIEEDEDL